MCLFGLDALHRRMMSVEVRVVANDEGCRRERFGELCMTNRRKKPVRLSALKLGKIEKFQQRWGSMNSTFFRIASSTGVSVEADDAILATNAGVRVQKSRGCTRDLAP